MRRRRNPFILVAVCVAILGIAISSLLGMSKSDPEQLVTKFYKLEQEGNFGSSWELFHSQMKQRFNKDQYIQSRAHVIMQDFKVKSFTFELGKKKKVAEWKTEKGAASLQKVYKIPIYQTFYSQFGKFTIEQTCYVTKEKGEWRLLWDYNGK